MLKRQRSCKSLSMLKAVIRRTDWLFSMSLCREKKKKLSYLAIKIHYKLIKKYSSRIHLELLKSSLEVLRTTSLMLWIFRIHVVCYLHNLFTGFKNSLGKYLLNFNSASLQGGGQGSHRLLNGKTCAAVQTLVHCMSGNGWLLCRICHQRLKAAECFCDSLKLSVLRFCAAVFIM